LADNANNNICIHVYYYYIVFYNKSVTNNNNNNKTIIILPKQSCEYNLQCSFCCVFVFIKM